MRGELKGKVEVATQFATKTAIAVIEKNGGKFVKTTVPMREAVKTDEK
jgi:ribosomal protein L15